MLSVVKRYIRVFQIMRAFPASSMQNHDHFFNCHASLRRTTLHHAHHHSPIFKTLFKLSATKLPLLKKKFHHRPMKKKGGTAAGVPRSTGETPSATTSNGAPRDQVCDLDFHVLSFCGREEPSVGDANLRSCAQPWPWDFIVSKEACVLYFCLHAHFFLALSFLPLFWTTTAVWFS